MVLDVTMAPPPHKDYSLNHSQIYLSGLSHVWESCLDPEELSNHQSLKSLPHKLSRLKLVPSEAYIDDIKDQEEIKNRPAPVNFQAECLQKIEAKFNITLVKTTRVGYQSIDGDKGFLCCISKQHKE